MAETGQHPPDEQLQHALTELGRRIAYPPTPDLASRVRARLEAAPAPARRRRFGGWRLAAALLAVIVALVAALVLLPDARATLSRWLGVRGIVFVMHPTVPTPAPTPVGTRLALGRRVTLTQARRAVRFPVLLPSLSGLRVPDEVYVGTPPPEGEVAIVYRARPSLPRAGTTGVGLLLTEFVGDLSPEGAFYFKGIEPGTQVKHVTVNGGAGYWLGGHAHLFFYSDDSGMTQVEDIRLAGNTLLWQRGAVTFRLESALSEAQALRIARSIS